VDGDPWGVERPRSAVNGICGGVDPGLSSVAAGRSGDDAGGKAKHATRGGDRLGEIAVVANWDASSSGAFGLDRSKFSK
jgi:hypothetical protein